jgi:nitrite reductase (NO-forming)
VKGTIIMSRFLILAALLLGALTACGSDTASQPTTAPTGPTADGPVLGTLEFSGFELAFDPATMQVEQPGRYAVQFSNTGHTEHDWVAGDTQIVAKPGETVRGEVVVPADGLEFVCSFPGHAAAGMRGTITVGAADAPVTKPDLAGR